MLGSLLLTLFASAAQPAGEVPLPPGHRPFGPPSRDEVLQGWETFVSDRPPATECANIGQPMVQPLNPPHREEGVAMLSETIFRELTDAEAARLLGIERLEGHPLAVTVFERFLEEMGQRKHRAVVERRDSWSVADQREFEALTARLATGEQRSYRPYLVRAVSKFGDGHDGPPTMFGYLCGGDLHLLTIVFSYTIPPSVPVPTVVFLSRPPARVIATVEVGW